MSSSWQNQQNDLCAQRRVRSAWTSAQSDQRLRSPHEERLGPPIERTAKTLIRLGGCPGWSEDPPRLIWVFAGRTDRFVGFVMRRLIYIAVVVVVILISTTFRLSLLRWVGPSSSCRRMGGFSRRSTLNIVFVYFNDFLISKCVKQSFRTITSHSLSLLTT